MNEKWAHRFMDLAKTVATWSKDPSSQVGAVIVDPDQRIVSLAYNGYPRYISDINYDFREYKIARVVHAEANAILYARQNLRDCIMVTTLFPCSQCAALIIQSGMTGLVTMPTPQKDVWGFAVSMDMFQQAKVQIMYLGEK